jgi:ATP-dependent helicase/DNAse subunit B
VVVKIGYEYSSGSLQINDKPNLNFGEVSLSTQNYFQSLSPTSLEKFIKCPYSYLTNKLGVKQRNIIEDKKLMLQGMWIHKVIECFFVGINENGLELGALDNNSEIALSDYLERIDVIADCLFDSEKIDFPSFYQVKFDAFPKLISWIFDLNQVSKADVIVSAEFDIAKLGVLFPNDHNLEIKLIGKLDGLFDLDEINLFIDYKTSNAPSAKDVLKGLAPQLLVYAYVLTKDLHQQNKRLDKTLENSVLAYWKVLGSELDISAVGIDVKSLETSIGKSGSKKPLVSDAFSNVLKLTNSRLDEVASTKMFKVDPGSHCDYCDFSNICRKNDPLYKDRFEENSSLKVLVDELGV